MTNTTIAPNRSMEKRVASQALRDMAKREEAGGRRQEAGVERNDCI
jgi:hypothetical protein